MYTDSKTNEPIACGEKKQANFFLQIMVRCTFRRQADLN
jgi:hypothetical protein